MTRVNVQKAQPEAYNAMFGLEKYLATSSIDAGLQEMERIRASLINQCQFCIGMHTDAARKLGLADEKINDLVKWTTSNQFSEKEKSVFALTDAMTNVKEQGVPNTVYDKLNEYFTDEEIAQLIMLNATINAWNRIGIAMSSK